MVQPSTSRNGNRDHDTSTRLEMSTKGRASHSIFELLVF
jgi:hypothetical protein